MINIQLMLVTVITFLQFSFFYTVISFPRVLHVFSNVLTNKPIFFNYSWCWKSTLACLAQIRLPLGPKWLRFSRRTRSNKIKRRSGYKNSIQPTAGKGLELNGYKDWAAGEKQNHSSGQQTVQVYLVTHTDNFYVLELSIKKTQSGCVGSDLWRSPVLLKQVYPEQVVQVPLNVASEDLQGGSLHNLWAICDNAWSPSVSYNTGEWNTCFA